MTLGALGLEGSRGGAAGAPSLRAGGVGLLLVLKASRKDGWWRELPRE